MARASIEMPEKDKTTIVTAKYLLDRMSVHVRQHGDNLSDFMTRAIVNQMENDGDISIRHDMEELNNGN